MKIGPARPFESFRLLDLPSEIREIIYAFAVPVDASRQIRITGKGSGIHYPTPQFTLAQSNRQVRQEALAVYFSSCEFYIRVSRRRDTGGKWLQEQDEDAIGCIRILIFKHKSSIDHGAGHHQATIRVDLRRCIVTQTESRRECSRCEEAEVVPKIIDKLQLVVDEVEAVDGKKRLTKAILGDMIGVATGMCLSYSDMCTIEKERHRLIDEAAEER